MTAQAVASASSQTTNAASNDNKTAAQQFAQAMKNASPESAKNGTEAAQDLLSSNNPYFYNQQLFDHDPNYNPETAKAQAFAATLYDYEQKGDNADIAQLLNTLGSAQDAKFFSDAGNLQGPQANDSGVVFAQNQAGLDQVLGEALLAPGVNLGNVTQSGSLANSLVKQGTQSGSDALSIAGILNQTGTGTQAEALKNQFLSLIEVDGKALGNTTTNSAFYDQASYAQAALTVINGDPTLLSQYQSQSLQEQQHGVIPTYQQLVQNAGFNPSNPSGGYQAGYTAGQNLAQFSTDPRGTTNFITQLNTHANDAQWLAGFFEGLGAQATASLIDYNPAHGNRSSLIIAQALGTAAPFLSPSYEQGLGQSAATQGIPASIKLDAVLHNLNPSQNYALLTNVGQGFMAAAASQKGNQQSVSYAMAADAFGMAALDNPAGRALVMNALAGQDLQNFAYQAVQGMALLAGADRSFITPMSPVAIPGISPLMMALNQPSAGSTANQMALQMFYGASDFVLGNPKMSLPLIQEEGSLGSHTVFVNGQPQQENLGLRQALMDVFYNHAPEILHTWEGSSQVGGLGVHGQQALEQFTAFELSPEGKSSVAQGNLDAMFNIAERFAFYSVGRINDPNITALVGTNESRRYAANIAGWILGSIANVGNTASSAVTQSAQALADEQQFQHRVLYDNIGFILDIAGLFTLPKVATDLAGEFGAQLPQNWSNLINKVAQYANYGTNGVGSFARLFRDWTYAQTDSALGSGSTLSTLSQPQQAAIANAINQAQAENVSVDNVMAMLENVYSQYNLPDDKDEIDNQFGIAGGTARFDYMQPYSTGLYSGDIAANVPSLSQWMDNPSYGGV